MFGSDFNLNSENRPADDTNYVGNQQCSQGILVEFLPPFGCELDEQNEYYELANRMNFGVINQWVRDHELLEDKDPRGRHPTSPRMAFCSLFIKAKEGLSDRKTQDRIQHDPHLQYFCGLSEFNPKEQVFSPSSMTNFRKLFTPDFVLRYNVYLTTGKMPPEGTVQLPAVLPQDTSAGSVLFRLATSLPDNGKADDNQEQTPGNDAAAAQNELYGQMSFDDLVTEVSTSEEPPDNVAADAEATSDDTSTIAEQLSAEAASPVTNDGAASQGQEGGNPELTDDEMIERLVARYFAIPDCAPEDIKTELVNAFRTAYTETGEGVALCDLINYSDKQLQNFFKKLPIGDHLEHGEDMIIDATVYPANIEHPLDINLLNKCREKLESAIRIAYSLKNKRGSGCPYKADVARNDYMTVMKKKGSKRTSEVIQEGVNKQLEYIEKCIRRFTEIATEFTNPEEELFSAFTSQLRHDLAVIPEIYRQQKYMYDADTHRVDDRIVSVAQEHVRPIVRGKEQKPTEFGMKVDTILVDGLAYPIRISWDAFNEGKDILQATMAFRIYFGNYPTAIQADQAYQTAENKALASALGIRMSGKIRGSKKEIPDDQLKIAKQDMKDRIEIEGFFGLVKRFYTCARIPGVIPDSCITDVGFSHVAHNAVTQLHRDQKKREEEARKARLAKGRA